MRHHSLSRSLSLLSLTLFVAAAGCAGTADDTGSDLEAPSDAPPPAPGVSGGDVAAAPDTSPLGTGPLGARRLDAGFMLALTPIQRNKSPLLADLMDGAPSRSRADLAIEPDAAGQIRRAAAVLIDGDAVTVGDLRSHASVLQAARLAGVPVLIENARDAEKVAAAVGVGIPAALVYAAPDVTGQRFDLRVYGDVSGEETEEHASARLPAGVKELYATMTADERAALGRRLGRSEAELSAALDEAPDGAPLSIDAPALTTSRSETAQAELPARGELLAEINDLLSRHKARSATQLVADPLPEGTYRSYNVTFPSYRWECDDKNQLSTIDRNYTVTLFASNAPEGKYVIFNGNGTQYNPGKLRWNNGDHRGLFQETLTHALAAPQLSPYKHRPVSANESSTFTTSHGFSAGSSVGLDGPSTSFGFDVSEQASRSLNDFDVVDKSAGPVYWWEYQLASVSGHNYNGWKDLHNDLKGGLYGLPTLAKNTLTHEFEGIFSAPADMQSLVSVAVTHKQKVRHTWISEDWLVYEEFKTHACTKTLNSPVTVDMSTVNVAKMGTIPFNESFDRGIPESVWTVVNQGVTDSTPIWEGIGGEAIERGGAFDFPVSSPEGAVDMRGTYLWAPRTSFGQGALSATITARDTDGFGLMYGIDEAGSSYYRVMFDASLSFARLVRVDDGVFTELAVNTSYVPPLAARFRVRVERQGEMHKIFVNDELVLVAPSDTTYRWGSVALFSWAMSDVRFDDVKITPLP